MTLLGVILVSLLGAAVHFGNDAFVALEDDTPSVSTGTPSAGQLDGGKRLPSRGKNFRAYSGLATLLGRNTVHSAVRSIVLESYEELTSTVPDQVFVYGETGWPHGGRFRPHRTHQNGASVDFLVPLRDGEGRVVRFPTHMWNKFGYGFEFDADGRNGDIHIDFNAVAAHLAAIQRAASRRGAKIRLFIITPEYLEAIWATPVGRELKNAFPVMTKPAWIRHDEHYHIDFDLPQGS